VEESERLRIEVEIALERRALDAGVLNLGQPSNFASPDCHGVLLRLKAGGKVRFRCHTGHAYTLDSLIDDMNVRIEEALWSAIRALDERTLLLRHLGEHLREEGDHENAATEALRQATHSERQAGLVRKAARDDNSALATDTITGPL
jgi:two-component system chemotaxis response regulator CheB